MLVIKDIKNSQVFYGKGKDGSPYRFKAWGDAKQDEFGMWEIECTDEGDYCYTFDTLDQHILYPTEDLTE